MFEKMWSEIHQSWFVVAGCVGVIFGMILGMVLRINYFASWWWILFAVFLLVIAYLKPKMAFVIIAGLAGMVLAFFRISAELVGQDYVRGLWGEKVVVAGVIAGDAETDEGATKFKLANLEFGDDGVDAEGELYVSVNANEDLKWGDTVVLEGKMLDGFGTYVGYLYKPKIRKWERPEPGNLVIKVRDWFAERITRLVPEPESKLGLSYLLGMKTGLPNEIDENLRVVGLTHIVVASGAHLAILVEVAKKIFGSLSRFAGLLFSVLFVLFFMCMVGWTPSILRAGIMTILTLLAWYVGRKFEPWRIILIVGAVTLMIEPGFLINMGWLLSFTSYGGIMVLGPKLTRFFYGVKKPGFVGAMVITTISATLMTLPIALYYYGQISLISVVANLLILPTLPWAMGLAFLCGVLAGVPGVEVAIGWCTTRMLGFHIGVVGWFGEMRQFLIEIPKYQWQVFLIYGLIVLALMAGWIWRKRKKVVELREEE